MKRVVVTGMGIVSSIGNDIKQALASLQNGASGITHNDTYKEMGFRSHISGSIKDLDLKAHIDRKQLRFTWENLSQAEEALTRTGLLDFAQRNARVLSSGEQQRLALARAWAMQPHILFLDEPTASLDPAVTRSIEELINAIHERGAKIVMSTHDLGQARRLADDILFLHRGRLLAQAPAAAFLDRPDSDAARAFIAGELYW